MIKIREKLEFYTLNFNYQALILILPILKV